MSDDPRTRPKRDYDYEYAPDAALRSAPPLSGDPNIDPGIYGRRAAPRTEDFTLPIDPQRVYPPAQFTDPSYWGGRYWGAGPDRRVLSNDIIYQEVERGTPPDTVLRYDWKLSPEDLAYLQQRQERTLLDQHLNNIYDEYPVLAGRMRGNVQVQYGEPPKGGENRQLEFYPPWERDNPNPGKATIEIYNRFLNGDELRRAIGGDMLHYLGSTDPRTGQAVDPTWRGLRDQLMRLRGPENEAVDRRAYRSAVRDEGEKRSFDDWMNQSRADAYVRGYMTPDAADEWRKQSVYSPEMQSVLQLMDQHLRTPTPARALEGAQ